ncbi:MAG: polysaccharide biosynthesis protein [Bacillota bacterium]|nr:polysaccharide biosynthesis protein [Bacillota bacterium]
MRGKTFIKGAAVLGFAGLLVQILGAVFRIPLANIIGEEGMGYYQTAYPIYIFLLVFSTNGAPAAISKMTSERIAQGNYREAHRIFKISFILMIIIGIITSAAVFAGAKSIVSFFGDPGAYYAMIAIAPALLFVPIMAVFRGYFQGYQIMGPTAGSQLTEQVVRVAAGLTLAVVLVPKGIEYAAAGASGAGSIGPVFGTLFILAVYMIVKKNRVLPFDKENTEGFKGDSGKTILARLAGIAIPITIGVSIFPIMNLVDLIVVMRRLQDVGFSTAAANGLYGQLSGYAGPIINIPQAMALAVSLSLVPAVAAANSVGDKPFLDQNIKLGLRTALIIGIPCSLGLMIIPKQIIHLIYPLQAEGADAAVSCLFWLGAGVVFICVAQAMAGILQGLGRPMLSVFGIVAGAAVKYAVSYILIGIKALNVSGAAIGTSAGLLTAALVNMYFVNRIAKTNHDLRLAVAKPLMCGVLMTGVVAIISFGVGFFIQSRIITVISVGAAAFTYAAALIRTGTILPDEIRTLPKGDKLYRLLTKLNIAE